MPKSRIISHLSSSDMTRFGLIKPIQKNEAESVWEYNQLRGFFDVELVPHSQYGVFPTRWCLDSNPTIYCQIKSMKSNDKLSTAESLNNHHQSSSLSQQTRQTTDGYKAPDHDEKHTSSLITGLLMKILLKCPSSFPQ